MSSASSLPSSSGDVSNPSSSSSSSSSSSDCVDDSTSSVSDLPLTLESCIEQAKTLKEEGNKLFKKALLFDKHTLGKNTQVEACTKYALALEKIKNFETEELLGKNEEFKSLLVSLYLNLAASGIKLESYDSSVNCCNAVLKIDDKNVKALYRRAMARLGEKKYEDALKDLYQGIKIAPNNKELRNEYKKTKELLEKENARKEYVKQTEEGMKRLMEKKKEEREGETLEKISSDWLDKLGLSIYYKNGSVLDDYSWGQNLEEMYLIVRVEKLLTSKDIDCSIKRTHFTLSIKSPSNLEKNKILIDRDFKRPVNVDESTWEIVEPGCLHFTFQKEKTTEINPPEGHEWWPCIFENDLEIDITDCDVGNTLNGLPEHARKTMEKAVWDEKNKSPEEKQKDDELRAAHIEAKKQKEQIDNSVEKAMSDPKKKAIYKMMQEKFPDIPVEFR